MYTCIPALRAGVLKAGHALRQPAFATLAADETARGCVSDRNPKGFRYAETEFLPITQHHFYFWGKEVYDIDTKAF